ncbi:MAG: glycosyltransferase [Rhodovibrionaceae bacterium]
MIRICILANARAVHTQRWAKALAERGHDVTVLSIRHAEIPGVQVVTKSVGPINSPSRFWSLLSYMWLAIVARYVLARLRPNVVNAHYCITHGSIARFSKARPRVVNLWGSDVLGSGDRKMAFWRRVLLRYSLSGADIVVSTSRYMAEVASGILDRQPKIHVVPIGVETDRFKPAPLEGADLPQEDAPVTVGFVKTFSAVYAPEIFLRAAALAAKEAGNLRFVMAGRGPLLAECRALAEDLGLSKRVVFPGFVQHDDVPELMRSFDILVNCSNSESFGVVICEAAATGLPVVATDVGGVRETVVNGETGLLVPKENPAALADAIIALTKDSDLRKRLGQAGRKMVERHYDWRKNVETFEALLAGLAASDR